MTRSASEGVLRGTHRHFVILPRLQRRLGCPAGRGRGRDAGRPRGHELNQRGPLQLIALVT